MDWKEWSDWKEKKYIAVIGFIIAYLLTIPIRDYSFLDGLIDITQGVPILAHLIIIIIMSIVLIVLLKIIEFIVKKIVLKS
jgi:hypothetical protein